jgi:hypothetical protein
VALEECGASDGSRKLRTMGEEDSGSRESSRKLASSQQAEAGKMFLIDCSGYLDPEQASTSVP